MSREEGRERGRIGGGGEETIGGYRPKNNANSVLTCSSRDPHATLYGVMDCHVGLVLQKKGYKLTMNNFKGPFGTLELYGNFEGTSSFS